MTHDLETHLLAERDRTLQRIESSRRNFTELVDAVAGANIDDEHDPEGTTIAYERAQLIAVKRDAEQRLVQLDAALDRLHRGEFGTCEHCGQPIGAERLMARPETTTCVGCAIR